MCVCVFIYIYIYIYLYLYVYIYIFINKSLYLSLSIYLYLSIHPSLYIYKNIRTCVTPERSILNRFTDQFPLEIAFAKPLVRMSSRTMRVMSHSSRLDTKRDGGLSSWIDR